MWSWIMGGTLRPLLCSLEYRSVTGMCMWSGAARRFRMGDWPVGYRLYAVMAFIESTSVVEVNRRFRSEFGLGKH
jgi:hypothetical protein